MLLFHRGEGSVSGDSRADRVSGRMFQKRQFGTMWLAKSG